MKYSTREIYPKVYGDKMDDAMAVLVRFSEENYQKYVALFEGAEECLKTIKTAGKPMSIVSNMRHKALCEQSALLNIDGYFQIIAGAGYAEKDKPDAAPLLKTLTAMSLTPGSHILYVGDTETDLLCAKAAGCHATFLYHDNPHNPLIAQYKPNLIAANCQDLKSILTASSKSS